MAKKRIKFITYSTSKAKSFAHGVLSIVLITIPSITPCLAQENNHKLTIGHKQTNWHKNRRYLSIADSTTTFVPTEFQSNGVNYRNVLNVRTKAAIGGKLSDKFVLLGGIQHDWTKLRKQQNADRFHFLAGRAVGIYLHSKKWRGIGFIRAGTGATNGNWSLENNTFSTGASLQWVKNKKLSLTFGLLYTNLFDPPILPLLGIKYVHQRWLVDFAIPRGGGAWFMLHPNLQIGAVLRIHNMRYQLEAPSSLLAQTNILTGGSIRWFVWQGLRASLEGGLSPRSSSIKTNTTTTSNLKWSGSFISFQMGYVL